jgi:alginate O-acetyltransferase complex protein AlgI
LLCYILAPLTARATYPSWLRRIIFWSLILAIVGYVFHEKYVTPSANPDDPELRSYAVPLGLSYISFRLMHMVVESARNPSRYRSLSPYLCNVFLFPTASAGPIERYEHFLGNRADSFRMDDLLQGTTRIIYGLIKRFVIAESLFSDSWREVTSGSVLEQLHRLSGFYLWKSAIAVFFYIYLDFSAYTDIAIGCCRLFGIRVMENFNWPIFAPNIVSFWKRWHMTLTGWCQSYVYMPMVGLTRRMGLATLATFLVIGAWHGCARQSLPWLLWGAYHGVGMIGYQYWARLKRFYKWAWCDHWLWYGAGVVLTLLFVSLGGMVALAEPKSFREAGDMLARMTFLGKPHA